MSDDQLKENLPGKEPDTKGGWHQPEEASLWQPPEQDEEKTPFTFWQEMPAFPEDLNERPQEQGGWHLPSPEDTVLTPDTTITKGEPIITEPIVKDGDSGQLSPEDMINQILGSQPAPKTQTGSLAAPEDFVIPQDKPEDADVVAPEDLVTETDEATTDDSDDTTDEALEEDVDDLLDSLEGLEGDAFDEDERTALMAMMDDDVSDEEVEELIDDMDSVDSSAELYDKIKRITDEMPELTQEQIDATETPTPPDTVDDPDDAAEFAKRMLQQLDEEDDETSVFTGLASGQVDLGQKADTSSVDPAEYARQMLGELDNGDEGDTGFSDTFGTQPYTATPQQQQVPQLDAETRATAERFREVENQVATLNFRYQNEEMNYDEYQRLLYDNMVQDENGAWWMIGANSDKWYRHDPASNAWEEDTPDALEALRDYEQSAQAQSPGYVNTQAPTAYDLPPVYGDTGDQAAQPGDPIYDDYGVQQGVIQPEDDEQYTMPGRYALEDEIPGQQPTIPSESDYLDRTMPSGAAGATIPSGTLDSTMPSASANVAYGDENIASAVDYSQPGAYDLDEPAPTVDAARKEQQDTTLRLLILGLVGVVALGLIAVIMVVIGIALWYSNAVEPYRDQIAALADYNPPFQTARIYDANGDLIVELNSQETGARTAIPLEEMSPYIIHAVISQENERFYQDPGFDPIAIGRAFFQNIVGGEIESGASTITQQMAKNLVLQDTDVTAERKINEILVALEIANQYDKNFILELYLNEVFFGNQSYGVEAASQFYFGHGADELNFAESALLASIIPSPASNDPVVNRPTAIAGMRETMNEMLQLGCLQFQHGDWPQRGPFCITSDTQVNFEGDSVFLVRVNRSGEITGGLATLQIAEIETAEYEPRNVRLRYPHFINFIQAEIEAEYGTNALFQRGFNIYTTLIPDVQETAQDALTRQVEILVDTGVNTGAVMVTDPSTGAIRAMVGSHDFSDEVAGQVNNALTYQQPGSSIKPVVYSAALAGIEGRYLTPASILWDVPVTYDLGGSTYTPVNFDRQYHGAVPLRFALQNSFNIAAVKAYEFIGNEGFLNMAQALGLQFQEGSVVGLASALGANEVRLFDMMEAYGTFANLGQRQPLYAIQRITETVEGNEVEVPLAPRPEPIQAISPQVAFLMTNILSDDNARSEEFGTNTNLTLARLGQQYLPSQNRVAAKTGTSNDSRDLWTLGYTRNVVTGVWLGTYDNSPTFNTTGFNSASPVWNQVMEAALRGRVPPVYANPGGVIAQEICRTTGTLFYAACPERTTDLFIQDKFPPSPEQGFVQTIAIDSWTGMRANEFCDDYIVERTFADISDPSAVSWLNTTPQGRAFAQLIGLPIPLQSPPAESCSQGQALPAVNITFPNQSQTIQGNVTIQGQVQGPNFARYDLAYASAQQPNNFIQIGSSNSQVLVNGSPLGNWDTTQVSNGNYTIRLQAVSAAGGSITVDVPVQVDNPLPTPTPTTVPLPTLDTSSASGASGITVGTAIPFPQATTGPGG